MVISVHKCLPVLIHYNRKGNSVFALMMILFKLVTYQLLIWIIVDIFNLIKVIQ